MVIINLGLFRDPFYMFRAFQGIFLGTRFTPRSVCGSLRDPLVSLISFARIVLSFERSVITGVQMHAFF